MLSILGETMWLKEQDKSSFTAVKSAHYQRFKLAVDGEITNCHHPLAAARCGVL
jgi:hypothetical protein